MATPASRPFHLTAAEGGPLRGAVRTAGGARPAVVICHGSGAFERWEFHPVAAERLARAGFAAVSFDGAGPGDLACVLAAVRAGDVCDAPPAVGLLGHGAGGAAAIAYAASDGAVRALVTWDAVPGGAAARVRAPWLLALGTGGGPAPPGPTERVPWAATGAGFDRALDATVAWFGRHLA